MVLTHACSWRNSKVSCVVFNIAFLCGFGIAPRCLYLMRELFVWCGYHNFDFFWSGFWCGYHNFDFFSQVFDAGITTLILGHFLMRVSQLTKMTVDWTVKLLLITIFNFTCFTLSALIFYKYLLKCSFYLFPVPIMKINIILGYKIIMIMNL